MSPRHSSRHNSPRPWGPGGPHRGPPPFVVQLLRAPLTINNIVALAITKSVQHHRKLLSLDDSPNAEFHTQVTKSSPCGKRTSEHVFGLLSLFFIVSLVHNVFTMIRFHRIRRSVFGESMCSARRRWRRGEMSEEERAQCGAKMREMGKRMPSVWISSWDVVLSVGFLGMWMLTTMMALKEGKVELGVGYASIGALVAFILNLIIGVNGLKLWARNKRQQKQEALEHVEVAANEQQINEKAVLLAN